MDSTKATSLIEGAKQPDDPTPRDQGWDVEPEVLESDDSASPPLANEPFDTSKIQVSHRTMALSNLIARLSNDEIKLDTEFQRLDNLWNRTQQSRLIES